MAAHYVLSLPKNENSSIIYTHYVNGNRNGASEQNCIAAFSKTTKETINESLEVQICLQNVEKTEIISVEASREALVHSLSEMGAQVWFCVPLPDDICLRVELPTLGSKLVHCE